MPACHSADFSGWARKRNSSAQASWRSWESLRTIERPEPPVGTCFSWPSLESMNAVPTSKTPSVAAVVPVSPAVEPRIPAVMPEAKSVPAACAM